jgi:hypothetical protein
MAVLLNEEIHSGAKGPGHEFVPYAVSSMESYKGWSGYSITRFN